MQQFIRSTLAKYDQNLDGLLQPKELKKLLKDLNNGEAGRHVSRLGSARGEGGGLLRGAARVRAAAAQELRDVERLASALAANATLQAYSKSQIPYPSQQCLHTLNLLNPPRQEPDGGRGGHGPPSLRRQP